MRRTYVVAMLTAFTLSAAQVHAQTPSQPMSSPQSAAGMPSAALVTACVEAQQQVAGLAAQVNRRIEDARQTNNPQQMRAALADLQAALVEIRTRAEQCSPLQAAVQPVDPHASHPMPGTAQHVAPGTPVVAPGSTTPAPAAPDPHAGHTTAATKAPAAVKPPGKPADPHASHASPESKTKARSKAPSKPADPHAGHATGKPEPPRPSGTPPTTKPGTKQTVDPVCGKAVDPATAPNTTYKGVTYYFCSPEDRLRFIRNPETYLKKAKQ